MASKYEKDTGRKITLPSSVSYIFNDPSILGENELIREDDEKYDENLRKGRIAAETLMKPMTFFEAIEALRMPKSLSDSGKKKQGGMGGEKKGPEIRFEDHHYI